MLLRARPGDNVAQRFDLPFGLVDFALASDSVLIGLNRLHLASIDLDTGAYTVLFESDMLTGTEGILIDPSGRILLLNADTNQIVRLDLQAGTQEVLDVNANIFDFDVIPYAGPVLQPGDTQQDLDFDQVDLVLVQVAAKYLTGEPATWGEGDWNGAPGGGPGLPPPGDGVFDQLDIIAALRTNLYLTGTYAASDRADWVYVPVPEPASILLMGMAVAAMRCAMRIQR
jgi:hypothetical protein